MNVSETFANRKIIVTGAAGFIGGHVAASLSQVPCRLALLDTAKGPPCAPPQGVATISRHALSIRDPQFLEMLRDEKFDYVFHFAGNANVATSVSDPAYDFDVNLHGSLGILETIKQTRHNTVLIYASSAAVYGNPMRLPISEADATVPISPYGVGKLAMERYLAVYCRLYGLRGASVRMFSPFGPRLRKQIVFELMQKLHAAPASLEVLGHSAQTRDFIYIDDVVSAILSVAERGSLDGTTYNIGRGIETPIATLVQHLIADMSPGTPVTYRGESMPGYPDNWCADISRIQALGWKPVVPLEIGLRDTVQWYLREYSQR